MAGSNNEHPETELLVDTDVDGGGARGCVLFVVHGPDRDRGTSFRLERGHARIGSGSGCDLVLHDSSVSREHAELAVRNDGIAVRDLGSTNGTFYLGQRIDSVVLRTGGRITLGRCAIDLVPLDAPMASSLSDRDSYGDLVGSSPAMRQLYALLERIEHSEIPVLIAGETGTGKELVARAIHARSPRADAPMLIVDCGNISSELVSSTLFGHRKGAFTGAIANQQGIFEAADGGTVFLDEIGELPRDLQPKLLRVLETGEVSPIGSTQRQSVDVRVIAATHRDLAQQVKAGEFREDLFYRLAVVQLNTPALRERREDIPLLVDHLSSSVAGGTHAHLPRAAVDFMVQYDWPGNVRELRNAVQRLLVLGPGSLVTRDVERTSQSDPDDPERRSTSPSVDMPYRDAKEIAMRQFERAYLKNLVDQAKGNISRAARNAEMDRKHLRELLKRHNLYRS